MSFIKAYKEHILLFFLVIANEMGRPCSAIAQSPLTFPVRLDAYTINNGLSESAVSAIAEDNFGEMCIGTEKGLDIFNGYDFHHFSNTSFEKINTGKPDNLSMVMQISKAGNGILFIRTNLHSFLFNPTNRSFITLDSLFDFSTITTVHDIYCMLKTTDGNDWMGINNGILIAEPKKEIFDEIPGFQRVFINDSTGIIALKEDNRHRVWAVTSQNNILIFDLITRKLLYSIKSEAFGLKGDAAGRLILCTGKNDTWIGSPGGVWHFDGIENHLPVFHRITLGYDGIDYSNIWVNCLLQDDQGFLWIGTQTNGIFLYKSIPQGQMVGNIAKTPFYPRSLNSNVVLCLMEDNHHRIWIGTEGGLNKYDPYSQEFSLYDQDWTDPEKQLFGVFSIVGADSTHIITISNGRPVLLNTITGSQHTIGLPGGKEYDTWFYTLHRDPAGKIWGGTFDGLVDIEKKGADFYIDTNRASELNKLRTIGAILPVSDTTVWLGTYPEGQGLYRWNPVRHSLTHYVHDQNNPHSLCENEITDIVNDSKGNIWIGTGNGLSLYNADKNQFENFLSFNNHSLEPVTSVSGMCDSGGYLWITTLNDGLIQFNLRTHAYLRYTTANGLPDNTLYGCVMDNAGRLWITSNKGISEFFIHRNKFKNFSKEDGLQSDEFDEMSAYKNKKGDLFFGGIYGINEINPLQLKPDTQSVPVYVSDIDVLSSAGGRQIFPGDRHSFIFSYNQDMLLFQFSALNFVSPQYERYSYRLVGLDKSWTDAGSRRSVIYSHIPPGKYTLQINATNEDGVWNEQPYSLGIIIEPPFWETVWFELAVIIIALLLLYRVYRLRVNALKKKHAERIEKATLNQKIVQLEKMALQAQMNPHFIFNSLNSIKAYILSNESDEAVEYLNDFAALIRKILQNSRKERISLAEELAAIDDYVRLEERRLKKRIVLRVDTYHLDSLAEVMIPPLMIQPFIENAIWHGIRPKEGDGEITIMIGQKEHTLLVSITDNGVGREKAKALREGNFKMQSMGVSITEERLGYFNKSKINNVEYEDLPGNQGTKVNLWIQEAMPFK